MSFDEDPSRSRPSPSSACARVRERLASLVERDLPPLELARDEGHLEACAECEIARSEVARVLALAGQAAAVPPAEWARARAALDARLGLAADASSSAGSSRLGTGASAGVASRRLRPIGPRFVSALTSVAAAGVLLAAIELTARAADWRGPTRAVLDVEFGELAPPLVFPPAALDPAALDPAAFDSPEPVGPDAPSEEDPR